MRFSGVALAALLAACQAAPAASPEATSSPSTATDSADRGTPSATTNQATPTGSAEPTATATFSATPTPKPSSYPTPDTFAVAVTDNLRVRTKPGVGDDSIKLEPLLWDGALVFVLDGPVAAAGYDWFLVLPMGEADLQYHPDPPGLGWVAAAGKDGEPWLADASFGCEAKTPFDTLSDFEFPPPGLIGLACFGNTQLQFEAALVPGSGDCDSSLEPAWLSPCTLGMRALADPARAEGDERTLTVVFDPAVGDALPAFDSEAVVNVTGQFDHPAARTCRVEPASSFDSPPELVILGCRARFVVTSIR